MPIIAGSFSGRIWRTVDPLPPNFTGELEKQLRRHAFRPINPEKHLRSHGWVNIRQVLDSNLTESKVLFRDTIALGFRVDKIQINQRLFRATMMQEIARILREQKQERLSQDQRAAIEEQVRNKMLREQTPSTSVYEMAWNLEQGLVAFAATSEKLNAEFAELFTQTFQVSLEPQFPYFRAQRWAKKQKMERELLELLPSPFSPRAPAEVVQVGSGASEE